MRRMVKASGVVVLSLFLMTQPAQAQSADFDSNMNAWCFTLDCSVVQFNLGLDPSGYVNWLSWTLEGTAYDAGMTFTGTVEAENGFWDADLFGDAIQISSSGDPVETPTWFRLGMTGVTAATQLNTGEAVRYNGAAWETFEDGVYSDQVSFGGYVTPEPATWSMLLTGLGILGLGLVRRQTA